MTGRVWRYSAVGLVVFIIGLVAFLPARVAAGWVEQAGPIALGGVTGTLFDGHAAYISVPGGAVEDVEWRVSALSLLLLRLSARIEVGSDLGGFTAGISRSVFGNTTLENLTGSASAAWLAQRAGYTFLPLSGDVRIDIRRAHFDDTLTFDALDGTIRMANVRWQLFNPPVRLGDFAAALSQTEAGLRLQLVDSEGPLALEGSVALDPGGRYVLDARLRARAGADDRLAQMLDQLGRADAQGWHSVREQGRL